MFRPTKARLAVAITAVSIAAVPAAAEAQTTQEGLVNIAISDVLVQVPIGVAANVCDVPIAVLSAQANGGAVCDATADSSATAGPNPDGNQRTSQSGLVNVFVDDVTVQLPIGVAANVCDVPIAVLSRQLNGGARCEAVATPTAG